MRGISKQTLNKFGVHVDNHQNIRFPLGNTGLETISYARTAEANLPKYLLPANFAKGEFLYGYDQLDKNNNQPLFITEGYFDVLSLHDAGLNAVGLLGTTLTDNHVEMLKNLGIKNISLALDRDKPGRVATLEVGKKLQSHGFNVYETINREKLTALSNENAVSCKDMNDLYSLLGKDIFRNLMVPIINFEDEVKDIVLSNTNKENCDSCIKTIETYLNYTSYSKNDDLNIENLLEIEKHLNVPTNFLQAVFEDIYNKQESKERVKMNDSEKKFTNTDVAKITKGKILPNGSGAFSINLRGINVNNIYVVENDRNGIFVNLPSIKGKDGKYYQSIVFGNSVKEQINFKLIQAYTELKAGIVFEEKQLPVTIKDEFNAIKPKEYGSVTLFNLMNPAFVINGMRHVVTSSHDFFAFPKEEGKQYSDFFATKEVMEDLKEKLLNEKSIDKSENNKSDDEPEIDF
jgi:DNA primase (bacterial type)